MRFVNLKQYIKPQQNIPALLQAGEPIRLEKGKTVVTGWPRSLKIGKYDAVESCKLHQQPTGGQTITLPLKCTG